MKKEIKKVWVKALRSGKYKKAKGQLSTTKGYCCLGVLTDLYMKRNKTSAKKGWEGLKKQDINNYDGGLSEPVMRWAGLQENDPVVPYVGTVRGTRKTEATLSLINDATRNGFKEIAGIIEKSL